MTSAAEIAERLNLRQVSGRREWRGACPACGYAAALVLSERDQRPLWHCVSCQDREAVTAALRGVLRGNWTAPSHVEPHTRAAPSTGRKTGYAVALWDEALPLPGTLADRYLAARGLRGVVSTALRFHPRCPHPGGARLPALVAAIRDTLTGNLHAVHRTFLRPDGGGKATAEPAKASLGPVAGSAVQMDELRAGTPLVIGEGIETSISAAILIGGTAWAAVSAGNLAVLPLPDLPACQVVVLAADPDPCGQRAAEAAARRWRGEGRTVSIATPDHVGSDFNDLLRTRLAGECHHG